MKFLSTFLTIVACTVIVEGESKSGSASLQPVIIDTDIGSDIDDSFAIALALQSSELLDVQLIVTCTDDTTARAKIAAKLLTIAGRDSVPIGIGQANANETVHTLHVGLGAGL